MSSSRTIEGNGLPRRWRIGVKSLLKLQLLLAPVLLIPVYARHSDQHPYVQLFAYLIAPACYVALLQLFWSSPPPANRWPILAAQWQGGRRGMLFAMLSVVPLLLMASWSRFLLFLALLANLRYATVRSQAWLNPVGFVAESSPPLDVGLFIALLIFQYALLGAAVAGIIAIAQRLRAGRQQVTLPSPQQACP